MKLLYYVPAMGDDNLETKHKILLHNLQCIYDNIQQKFSVVIHFYTVSPAIKASIQALDFIENSYFYEKPGVLTELFLKSPANEHVPKFDYILFVLDDVKLVNVDILNMIQIKEKYKIEILSPKIFGSTWPYMNTGTGLTVHNCLEVYCLLLTPVDFVRFCATHTVENKWMWGPDLLFGYYGIKAAVINTILPVTNYPAALIIERRLPVCRSIYRNIRRITNL